MHKVIILLIKINPQKKGGWREYWIKFTFLKCPIFNKKSISYVNTKIFFSQDSNYFRYKILIQKQF